MPSFTLQTCSFQIESADLGHVSQHLDVVCSRKRRLREKNPDNFVSYIPYANRCHHCAVTAIYVVVMKVRLHYEYLLHSSIRESLNMK